MILIEFHRVRTGEIYLVHNHVNEKVRRRKLTTKITTEDVVLLEKRLTIIYNNFLFRND